MSRAAWIVTPLPLLLAAALVPAVSAPREAWPDVRGDRGLWMVRGAKPALPKLKPSEIGPDMRRLESRKKERKAWLKERHRAGPGVDFKAQELLNGKERMEVRRLANLAAPPNGEPDDADAWTERGSQNQAGRTHVARITPDGTLYVGSSLGGVWRQEAADRWTPLADGLYGGAHWLEVLPGTPDRLIVGTDGGQLHVSGNDGATWVEPTGLQWAWVQRKLTLSSDGTDTLYAVRGNSDGYTVWRSVNDGDSFEEIYDLGAFPGDLWTPRTGSGRLYLATENGLWVSDNQGDSWTAQGTWPASSQAEIVGSEGYTGADGAPRLYVVLGGSTLTRSDDGGANFTTVSTISDYWGALNASITNPDLFVYGGVELHKSSDGGATFSLQNAWWEYYDAEATKLHADLMGIDVQPAADGGETWLLNTDGGTYRSDDGLETTANQVMLGLRISQYYGTYTSVNDPELVAAGAQDQGYQVTAGQTHDSHVLTFDQIYSGDYAHLSSGDGSHDLVYSVYPGFFLIQVGEENPQLTYADFPSDARAYAWLPPVVADPDEPERCFFLGDELWAYERDSYWIWEPTRWNTTAFGLDPYEYLSGLAISPLDHDRMYAVSSGGKLFRSTDHGVTWERSATGLPGGQYFYGTAIVASATDIDTVWVGGSGYSNPAVYRSIDGGNTFEAVSDGLPSTLVYSLVEQPTSGTLYAGTETSAWRLAPGSSTWEDLTGSEAPITIYWSAELVPELGSVRFGTYGRGIWDYVYDADLDGCFDEVDADADGSPCDEDCDDADGARAPGRADPCGDSVDQDCSGADAECDDPDDPDDPDDTNVEADPDEPPADSDCGCGAPVQPALALGLLAALGVRRRR